MIYLPKPVCLSQLFHRHMGAYPGFGPGTSPKLLTFFEPSTPCILVIPHSFFLLMHNYSALLLLYFITPCLHSIPWTFQASHPNLTTNHNVICKYPQRPSPDLPCQPVYQNCKQKRARSQPLAYSHLHLKTICHTPHYSPTTLIHIINQCHTLLTSLPSTTPPVTALYHMLSPSPQRLFV